MSARFPGFEIARQPAESRVYRVCGPASVNSVTLTGNNKPTNIIFSLRPACHAVSPHLLSYIAQDSR